MSAILVPGVNHRLLPGKSRTLLQPQIISVHTMVWDLGNCERYFAQSGNPYSHFGTGHDGEIRQWQDLRYRAASDLDGNPYNISIENADKGAGFPTWSGSNVPAFTDDQADSLVVLLSWLCHRFNLPKTAIGTSCPHERGIGWHRLGINPYRNTSCGRRWSSAYGKACPGDRRIHQLTTEIIPAVSAPTTTATLEEDPMWAIMLKTMWAEAGLSLTNPVFAHELQKAIIEIYKKPEKDRHGGYLWYRHTYLAQYKLPQLA